MCLACVQQARSSPENHSFKPVASSLGPAGLPLGGSCSPDELFWHFMSCNLLSQRPQHTPLPRQHDQRASLACTQLLSNAMCMWERVCAMHVCNTVQRPPTFMCFFLTYSHHRGWLRLHPLLWGCAWSAAHPPALSLGGFDQGTHRHTCRGSLLVHLMKSWT